MLPREVEVPEVSRLIQVEHAPSVVPRPFDAREIERLPRPTDRDPPYRPWWVVE